MNIGDVYGRLTVIAHDVKTSSIDRKSWFCRCECGVVCTVREENLRSGNTLSCGCLKRELVSTRRTKHGMSRSPEYRSWCHILDRCNNPNDKKFPYYGGQGIKNLFSSFEEFYEVLGPQPTPQHTVDRYPNNRGNYEPGNVRWATPTEQASNRRSNAYLTLNGQTLTIDEWEKALGWKHGVIHGRLKMGWSVEKTLTTPVKYLKPRMK